MIELDQSTIDERRTLKKGVNTVRAPQEYFELNSYFSIGYVNFIFIEFCATRPMPAHASEGGDTFSDGHNSE